MTNMPTASTLGVDELVETLTGYEEQEIEGRFGATPDLLLATKPVMALRALAMVEVGRALTAQDVKDPKNKAYKQAMTMTLKEVETFFPDEAPEVDPEQPVTATGEGDGSDA